MSVSDPPDPTDEVHVDPDGNFALSADDLAFSGSEHYSETASKSAEQMMLWVNYYSLFCLYNILSANDYECWRHFVLASRLLCKPSPTTTDISIADKFLLQFCRRFETIYGDEAITPNMHMHGHLAECILEYGPMSSFWLFSFERYNGILGDQPTNNRSIELQLMYRFIQDNSHILMLTTGKDMDVDTDLLFDRIVKEHAFGFHSMKHIDTEISIAQCQSSGLHFTPAPKYSVSQFSSYRLNVVLDVYVHLYPEYKEHLSNCILPSSFKKMSSITIGNKKLNAGQFVYASSIFQICSHSQPSMRTLFFDPSLHAAKICYFIVHSFDVNGKYVTGAFAVVNWLLCHQQRHAMGRPLQIWHSTYEHSPRNFLIPLKNVSCLLLTANHIMEEETVLVTIPTML
jgi:hypothetical protein